MSLTLIDSIAEVDNNVLTVSFNRHDVRNALTSTAIVDDIIQAIEWAEEHDIGAIIFTGKGSAFSSGGNIKEMAERSGAFEGDENTLVERYKNGIQRMPIAVHNTDIPTIAAINGAAVGAGFDLANMCDFRLASNTAKMGETFITLGIIPGDGGAWFLQRLVGYQKAAELTFSGRIIDANEALTLGLLLDVCAPEDLLDNAKALAERIAMQPHYALKQTKRLMKEAQQSPLAPFLDDCARTQAQCHHHPDHLVAVHKMLDSMKKN